MLTLARRLPLVVLLAAILFLPFALLGLHMIELPFFGGSLLVGLYVCLLLVQFEIGFFILIFARSSLDYVKEMTGGAVDLAGVVSVAIIGLAVFFVLYKKANIFRYAETLPFIFFLVAGTFSYGVTKDLMLSVSDTLRLTSVYAVYLVTRIVAKDLRSAQTLFRVILASSLIPLGIAIFEWASGDPVTDTSLEYGRLMGTFSHPNAFATYLLIILVFNVALLLERRPFVSRKFILTLSAVTFVVFVMTYSRGAWISFVVALLVIGVIRYRRIFFALPVGLLILIATVPTIRDRFDDILHPARVKAFKPSALDWRKDAWENVTSFYEKQPVFGNGLSMVEHQLGFLTHNDYLRLLAETGFVGLAAYAFLMGTTLWRTWGNFRRSSSPQSKTFNLALLAVLVSLVVRQSADNTLRHTVVMIYLWSLVALARALTEAERAEARRA